MRLSSEDIVFESAARRLVAARTDADCAPLGLVALAAVTGAAPAAVAGAAGLVAWLILRARLRIEGLVLGRKLRGERQRVLLGAPQLQLFLMQRPP